MLVAQIVKNPHAVQKTWVQSLGWEDPWEGNGSPLQYSCLENSMDREAWWASAHGVLQSQTQLRDSHTNVGSQHYICLICATLYFEFSVHRKYSHHKTLCVSCHWRVGPLDPFCPPPYFPSDNNYSLLCIYVFMFDRFFIYFSVFYNPNISEIMWCFFSFIPLSIILSKSIPILLKKAKFHMFILK